MLRVITTTHILVSRDYGSLFYKHALSATSIRGLSNMVLKSAHVWRRTSRLLLSERKEEPGDAADYTGALTVVSVIIALAPGWTLIQRQEHV
jgi:hypothetical protein